jgi:hypothetical protein
MAIDYAAINALTNEWGANKAQLDENENRLRINYNNVLDRMKKNLGENRETSAIGLADRGITHSGAAMKQGIDLTTAYNEAGAQAAQKQNIDLASIARKRLEQDNAYNMQKLLMQVPEPPKEA